MAFPDWSESLQVGLPDLDRDHRTVVRLLGDLAAQAGASPGRLMQLAPRVVGHLREHFVREETLMRRHRFFAFPLHRAEHLRVLAELDASLHRLEAGDYEATRHYFVQTLPKWFFEHLRTIDTVTAKCILEPGCGEPGDS